MGVVCTIFCNYGQKILGNIGIGLEILFDLSLKVYYLCICKKQTNKQTNKKNNYKQQQIKQTTNKTNTKKKKQNQKNKKPKKQKKP
jgi:hypothetical protein